MLTSKEIVFYIVVFVFWGASLYYTIQEKLWVPLIPCYLCLFFALKLQSYQLNKRKKCRNFLDKVYSIPIGLQCNDKPLVKKWRIPLLVPNSLSSSLTEEEAFAEDEALFIAARPWEYASTQCLNLESICFELKIIEPINQPESLGKKDSDEDGIAISNLAMGNSNNDYNLTNEAPKKLIGKAETKENLNEQIKKLNVKDINLNSLNPAGETLTEKFTSGRPQIKEMHEHPKGMPTLTDIWPLKKHEADQPIAYKRLPLIVSTELLTAKYHLHIMCGKYRPPAPTNPENPAESKNCHQPLTVPVETYQPKVSEISSQVVLENGSVTAEISQSIVSNKTPQELPKSPKMLEKHPPAEI